MTIGDSIRSFLETRGGTWSLAGAERALRPRAERVVIPTFHRTPPNFEEHVAHLKRHYSPISGLQLVGAIRHGETLPQRPMLVTFDDAYRDFADRAWPVLKSAGMPVVLFVPTGFPDRPERVFWWDRLAHALTSTERSSVSTPVGVFELASRPERWRARHAIAAYLKSLDASRVEHELEQIIAPLGVDARSLESDVLGWDEIRRLSEEGVEIAAHTRTHPLLGRSTATEIRREVEGSRMDLEREVANPSKLFAYPAGSYDPLVKRIVRDAGFQAAVTMERGTSKVGDDPFQIRRIDVSRPALGVMRLRLLQAIVRPHNGRTEVRSSFALFKNRIVWRSLDAMVTSGLVDAASHTPKRSRYEQVRRVTRRVLGRHGAGIARRLMNTAELPFELESIEPVAYGTAATVYRVRTSSRDHALKVYRDSIGLEESDLLRLAQRKRDDEALAEEWFGSSVVLRTSQVLLRAPLRRQPAAAGLQKFLGGTIRDVFSDLTLDELVRLASANYEFERDLRRVCEAMIDRVRDDELCPDLIGHLNLCVEGDDARPRLRLLDAGAYFPADLDPKTRSQFQIRQERLTQVLGAIRYRRGSCVPNKKC